MAEISKVAVCLRALPHGGGTYQYNLSVIKAALDLDPTRFAVEFFAFDPSWIPHLQKYSRPFRIIKTGMADKILWQFFILFHLPVAWWRNVFFKLSRFQSLLVREKFQIGVFPSQDEHSFLTPGIKTLCAIHDLMHRYEPQFPEVGSWLVLRHREYLYQNICRWNSLIVADSEMGRRHVSESFGRPLDTIRALHYIPPDYVLNASENSENEKGQLPELPSQFFFYPAQFWAHKNHLRLLEAIKLLKDDGVSVKMVLVGSKKNNYEKVMSKIREYGLEKDVLVLGYVSDQEMVELYRRSLALVMPTFFGPTNIPPLEAAYLGRPSALSNNYAMPEQIGDAAVYFDPTSAAEIADAMRKLWTNPQLREKLSQNAQKLISNCSQEVFNHRFAAVIDELVV